MLAGWRRCHTSLPAAVLQHSRARVGASYSTSSDPDPSTSLRQLMRKVAQPVAVITANLNDAEKLNKPDHGATISSFVSIALHPTPLVAFALRLPSRLATFLNANRSSPSSSSPSPSPSSEDTLSNTTFATFKIHLLSEEQEDIARAFARQLPLPNKAMPSSSSPPHLHMQPFPPELFSKLQATSLGSLECVLAGDLPLVEPLFQQDSTNSNAVDLADKATQQEQARISRLGQATSQLFIAKVVKVNEVNPAKHPLLYYHQKYCVLDME